jgi:hypothetical protein
MLVLSRDASPAGESPPTDSLEVCERIRVRCGIDTTSARRIVSHTRGREPLAAAEIEPLVERYLAEAQAVVAYLDRFSGDNDQ